MKILSVDIGGTGIKALRDDEELEKRTRITTGPDFTPQKMLKAIEKMRPEGDFDVLSIGMPTAIRNGKPVIEPVNLGPGWVGFDFAGALGKPVRLINDAAMQAVGSYEGGKMLFLGLGTGLGTALVNDYQVDPMELAHLPYKHDKSFEDHVSEGYREKEGTKAWRKEVWKVVDMLYHALLPEYVCLGGGNAKRIGKHSDEIPDYVRLGANANAFTGGFRVWKDDRFESSVPVLKPGA